ncbi:hypothetical protein BC938DRAFT_473773, partial [Jimgerdemannia flammicorona]
MNIRETIGSASWDEENADPAAEVNKLVMPVLTESLEFDLQRAAEEAVRAVTSEGMRRQDTEEIRAAKPKQPLTEEEQTLEAIEKRLQTLQLSLELLSNICIEDTGEGMNANRTRTLITSSPTDDGWEDADETMLDEDGMPEDDASDKADDDDATLLTDTAMIDDTTTSTPLDENLLRSNPILHTMTYTVFPALVRLATPTSLSFPAQAVPTVSTNVPAITNGLALVHLRALECLNNFLLAMCEVPTRWWFRERKEDAVNAWNWLFATAEQVAGTGVRVGDEESGQEMRGAVLEAVVGCLWMVARGLNGDV